MGLWPRLVAIVLLAVAISSCASSAAPDQGTVAPIVRPTRGPPVPTPGAPASPQGQTYYVDRDGDDGDDGSSGHPWRTLQHAVDSVAPGDTILVRGGTYDGCRIENSGTAGAWITLKAAPGAGVLVNAPGPDNAHQSNIELETWEGAGTVAHWVIEGLEVANAPNWGIDVRGSDSGHSHHVTIRGNVVHDNGLDSGTTGIFFAFVDDVTIEYNESYANGEHGIYLSNSGDRFTVRNNDLHHNAGCGLHMNGDLSQGGDGIISDGLVEANVIYENGAEGGAGINMDGVTDTIVRNNLIYENHAGGIAIFQGDGAVCSRGNRFLNNTIVMADDGRWAINISGDDCTDNKLWNNIIYSYHSWRGSIVIPSPSLSGFESDYNVVMDRFSADDDSSVIPLAEWQALGYDLHSLIALPDDLFAGPAQDDYALKAGSPAIDAGDNALCPDTDIRGFVRPVDGDGDGSATCDIGAYEWGEGTEHSYLPLVTAQEEAASTPTPTPTPPMTPAPTAGPTPAPSATPELPPPPQVGQCDVLPADNIWNVPVDTLPLDPNSALYVQTIGATEPAHADFGSGEWPPGSPIGIPYVVVSATQPLVTATFYYPNESDPGPYPIPPDAPIEGGPNSTGDRHVIVVDRDRCTLYELYDAWPREGGSWWEAGSGAIFDLDSHALRPAGWTSADAAGLPILPGLVRYEEVAAGEIRHAIRFTAPQTRRAYVWPARHYASSHTGEEYPPMGQRFRLRADFDVSGFSPEVQVILQAMKTYGIILADNGSPWYISGVPDERWDNDALHELHQLQGADFEAVDVSALMVDPDSGQARWP